MVETKMSRKKYFTVEKIFLHPHLDFARGDFWVSFALYKFDTGM